MRFWLVNASEALPDDGADRRPFRMGILADQLAAEGHEAVRISSSFDHLRKRQRERASGAAILIDAPSYLRHVSVARIRHNRALGRGFVAAVTDLPRPDAILVSFPPIELADAVVRYGQAERIPVVVDVRDMWPDVAEFIAPDALVPLLRLATWPMRRQARRALLGAASITTITDEFLRWSLDRAGRARRPLDAVFPFGFTPMAVEAERAQSATEFWDAQGLTGSPEQTIVLYAGAISRQFDAEPILESARLLAERPGVHFVLCGWGDQIDDLRRRSAALPNVTVPGRLDMPELQVLQARSSLGLVSMFDRPDYRASIPNKVPEYLSAGLPVAVSHSGGVVPALLAANDCGFSYDCNAAVLTDHVRRLHEDPDRATQLGAAARATYEAHFRADDVYSAFVAHLVATSRTTVLG